MRCKISSSLVSLRFGVYIFMLTQRETGFCSLFSRKKTQTNRNRYIQRTGGPGPLWVRYLSIWRPIMVARMKEKKCPPFFFLIRFLLIFCFRLHSSTRCLFTLPFHVVLSRQMKKELDQFFDSDQRYPIGFVSLIKGFLGL